MTTTKTVGAVSREAAEWYAINWQTIHQNVRRLQVRIVQATKAGRWNKVKSLQRLLTHSYSGKVLAVRRVTENTGKKTPGVDQILWKTPEDKTQAVHALKSRVTNHNLYDASIYPNLMAEGVRSEFPA
jgi:RNA-directed DNA polymerase